MVSIDTNSKNFRLNKSNNKKLPKKFNYMKNKVAIIKLDDYHPKKIKLALRSIIDLLGIKDNFNGKSILIKPNALAPSKNAFTPPEIIIELSKILRNEGNAKEILVGDSTFTKTFTNITFKRSKIKEKCEERNIKLVNFFESERVKVEIKNPTYDIEKNVYLPKEIHDANIIINLPKLKTHNGYVYTGAIKNLFGLLGNKMNMHMTHKNKIEFQQMLADIYFAVEETNKTEFPKVLTVMDLTKSFLIIN